MTLNDFTKNMTFRKKIFIGLGLVAVFVVIWFVIDHLRFVKTDNAQLDAHTVILASKISGVVVAVKVAEGQKVKKGDVMVQIDPRDYQNVITQIGGERASIEAKMKDAEKNYGRIAKLFSGGAVSSQQNDTASANYLEIKAKYDAVKAQVSQAELNLENTQIRAPNDGFIAKKSVEEGQLASPGSPLVGFVEAGPRWVTANYKETEISDIKVGADALVSIDAIPGKRFKGKVESISPATGATFTLLPPDNATGNFTKVVQRVPVKIALVDLGADDVEILRAGLSATVEIYR